jgi:hypothetical protein
MSKQALLFLAVFVLSFLAQVASSQPITIQHVGSFKTGRYNVGAAEIVAHDAA